MPQSTELYLKITYFFQYLLNKESYQFCHTCILCVMVMFKLLGVWMNELNWKNPQFPHLRAALSPSLSFVVPLKFILAGWLMQMSKRHRRRASMFAFRLPPSLICSAGQHADRTTAQLEEVFNRLALVSDCGIITGWLVKITRKWWEEKDWGTGLYFTHICSWLQVFFMFFPSVASAVT